MSKVSLRKDSFDQLIAALNAEADRRKREDTLASNWALYRLLARSRRTLKLDR